MARPIPPPPPVTRATDRLMATGPSRLQKITAALAKRTPRLLWRNRLDDFVVVPGIFRLVRLLDLKQVHIVQLPAIGADRSLAEQRIIRRQLLHLVHDSLAVGRAFEGIHGAQVVKNDAIDAGLHRCGIAIPVSRSEALTPGPWRFVQIPIERLGELQALRDFQSK